MDHSGRRPADGSSPDRARTGRVRLAVRLLFFEVAAEAVLLDCIAASGQPGPDPVPLEPGEPVSLIVALPGPGWRAAGLASLARWARDSRLLTIDLMDHGARPAAKVTDHKTTVVFDLLAPTA